MWKAIVERSLPVAVVFEDDVIFSDAAGEVLRDLSWVPDDADIVRLETWLSHSVVDTAPETTVIGRGVHRLRSVQYGTAAYVITLKGAEKALRLTETFVDTADDFLFNPETPFSREFITYQMLPSVCVQDLRLNRRTARFTSGIERGSRPDRPTGMRLIWREVRRSFKKGLRPARMFVANVIGRRRWKLIEFQ